MFKPIFYVLLSAFVVASVIFLVLGVYATDTVFIIIAILFAICAVLISLENRQNLRDPFSS